MEFEEYLSINKDKLQPKINKEAMWDQISNKLPPPKAPSYINQIIIFGFLIVVAALVLTLYIGRQNKATQINDNNKELIALKSEIKSLLNNVRTSSRIRAVNLSQDAENIDQEIIATLIDRMTNDSSPNVQLAAIRALENHLSLETVRVAMIETLTKTQDSYIQIKLINMLSQYKEQRLLPFLDSIIGADNKKSIVLEQAEKGKKILKEI